MLDKNLQLEVSIQDFFWSSSLPQSREAEIICPVSTETWEKWFGQWLEIVEPELPPANSYEVSLRLTGDEEIQSLNSQYRHQNKPTDVLAFSGLEVDCPQLGEIQFLIPVSLGDIVISVDTAARQARQQGHLLKTELAWLAAHGFLHLLGWDHPDEEALMKMLDKQANLLQAVGLTIEADRS